MFLEEVVQDDAEAKLLGRGKIDGHRLSDLPAIGPSHRGRTRSEESVSFLIGVRLAVMRVSPWTVRPFSSVATRCTFESVEGKMRPRIASTLLLTRIALVKSPVT